jgi:hypothetical protein
MNELHDRIDGVINTLAFEACLDKNGLDLIEFQCTWREKSEGGNFDKLPQAYKDAILAGEAELKSSGEKTLSKPLEVC